ncbi:unnamed protein product [Phytomonas sp. Hart1]|nr:unnamed protein product [Phytomonas sp. Hart1]|eukprot:CCW69152.1 unnamed protein product [Phytomonas sp. isolate Hart1]
MDFPGVTVKNKSGSSDEIISQGHSPQIPSDVAQHPNDECSIPADPAGHNFPKSVAFLWQVLNDMGLVETAKTLRGELTATEFRKDVSASPIISATQNLNTIGFTNLNITTEIDKAVSDHGIEAKAKQKNSISFQYSPQSLSSADETKSKSTPSDGDIHTDHQPSSSQNFSFRSLLEEVLKEKLGENEQKTMKIVQVLSYYTVEPLTGALSSLEHVQRGSSGSSDDVMNSIGQVNRVVNVLSDLYDHLTTVALANTSVNNLACEEYAQTTFPLSSLPSVLKRVFLLYCSILLLQQNMAENEIICDIASKWTTCSAHSLQKESNLQTQTNAVAQEDPTLYSDDDGTKKLERNPNQAFSNGQPTTASNGKTKPRKKRRASLSKKPTTFEEDYDPNKVSSHSMSVPSSSVSSNEEEKTHTTKAQQRCFHRNDSHSTTTQGLLQLNILQCACQLLSCTHTLHMTLAAHHAQSRRTSTTEVSENNTSSDLRQNSSRVDREPSPLHNSPAIEIIEQALKFMNVTNGLWKRRAELVLRRVLQRSSLPYGTTGSAVPASVISSHNPSVGQGVVETGKVSPVGHQATTSPGVNGWQDMLTSIQAVADACRAPAFHETNKGNAGVATEKSELYAGMEAYFLPRCPFCDCKQSDTDMPEEKKGGMTEEDENRTDREKISFVRIWHIAERARNILWILQSAEEHVRLMHLSTGSTHCGDKRNKALEEAISVWEGQWAAHCGNVLEQTLLVRHEHGTAVDNKEGNQEKKEEFKAGSCLMPSGRLEYRRHRYERLFKNFSISLSAVKGDKGTTQNVSGHLPVMDHMTDENQIRNDGATASDGMPYLSPIGESRKCGIANKDMNKKTLWDVFLNSVYVLMDGFRSAAVQLLLDSPIFDIDTTPSKCIGKFASLQGEEVSTLPGGIPGLKSASNANPFTHMGQAKRSRVYAQLFSSFVPFTKVWKTGQLQSESHDPFELSIHRGFPKRNERGDPSSLHFAEKGNVSEVFPYAEDLFITYKATSQQSHGVEWGDESDKTQAYQDKSPDDWAAGRSDTMENALCAVMRSLQSGILMDGTRRERRIRPLRQCLRRALAHQHIILNAQFTEVPLRLQIRALQNSTVLEAVRATASKNNLAPGEISEDHQSGANDHNATHNQPTGQFEAATDILDTLKLSMTGEGNFSVNSEAALLPTSATAENAGTNAGVLSARTQTISSIHLSSASQSRVEEERADREARQRPNTFPNTGFSSPTLSAIRRIAQDIGMTVERVIMTSDIMNWRIEGRTTPPVPMSPSNIAWNAVDEETEGLSAPQLSQQQAQPYRLNNALMNNTTTAEEEDSPASDASSSKNHFNRAADVIAEEVQQITVTPCGTLVAFVTTRGRLVVYALREHAEESNYKEELLIDTVLPGTPKHPHWYEAHSAIVWFSPDGRFVMASVQFMPRGVAEGDEEDDFRFVPPSTGHICIFSLYKERYSASEFSSISNQKGSPNVKQKPFKKLFQLPNRLYAVWEIHCAPITVARWVDPRFWCGGWTSPQDAFLDLQRKEEKSKLATDQQSFVSVFQSTTNNFVDKPETTNMPMLASSAVWHISARARLAVFQCFSAALDDLIIRWLPCSGVVLQRIAATLVQDLIISPLMTALYTIDDKGFLSMYDAWNEAEKHDPNNLGYLSSSASSLRARPTVTIGNRGLPASVALLQTPEEKFNLSSRRQAKLITDQELPHAFFYGARIIRFDRSDITAQHRTNPENLAGTNSSSSLSLLMTGTNGNKTIESGTGSMNYLSRFLRLSATGMASRGGNPSSGNVGNDSLLSQGMNSHRSAQIGHKLIQSVLAVQVSSPPPNSVYLSPSSNSTLRPNTTSESEDEAEEYLNVVMKERGGVYSLCVENETDARSVPSSRFTPQVAPSHQYRDISGIPNALYKSWSRLVFSEIGRALCLSGNIMPLRHDVNIENAGIPYRLLSLAISGQPQWSSAQHDGIDNSKAEEAMYRTLIYLWESRKTHGLNSNQAIDKAQDSDQGYMTDNKGVDCDDIIDIDEVFSISYFTDYHSRGCKTHNDASYSSSKGTYNHNKARSESHAKSDRSFEFAARSGHVPELYLEPTARNGRYLALMASVGPQRVLVDRMNPLERRPGLYSCLIFDTYMSYVVRVVAVCPVQPVASLSQNGTIPSHNGAIKAPIFSLQCSLTVIGSKPVVNREYDGLARSTHSCYREANPANSIENSKDRISAIPSTGGDSEKIILTVGGLHNTLYIFDALSGDRVRTVKLREADFARIIQPLRTHAMGGAAAQDLCEGELHRASTISLSLPADGNNINTNNRKGVAITKEGKSVGFHYMRGAKLKVSVEDILCSLSTWGKFEGPNPTARSASDNADSRTEGGRPIEKTTMLTHYYDFDKIRSLMADLSEGDHTWSMSGDECEANGKYFSEEVPKGKGELELRHHGVRHLKHKSRHWLIDQLVRRYGLSLVLYAQQCLTSVIYWPAEMGEPFPNGSHGITVHGRNHLEKGPQGEDQAWFSEAQWKNPDLQSLFSPQGGETEGRMFFTNMFNLSCHLCVGEVTQKYRNPLSGPRDHLDKHCGNIFHARAACFDEPFKLAVEQLIELSHVIGGITQGVKNGSRSYKSSPFAEMVSEICRGDTTVEEPVTLNANTNNCDTQDNNHLHLPDTVDIDSNAQQPESIFKEIMDNIPNGNNNRKLLNCGVVNTVATWWSEEGSGASSQRGAFYVLAGTESGQLHIVGGFL